MEGGEGRDSKSSESESVGLAVFDLDLESCGKVGTFACY